MDTYATSIMGNTMMRGADGLYYGTIAATKHNMGTDAFVVRAVYKNDAAELENVLCAYKTAANGDITIYVDEPVTVRVTIGRGNSVTSASILEEGEEYADA